jgi:hypothetical protein
VNQSVLTLTPGGRPLAQNLGFEAAIVIVDNYTSSYVTLGDVGKTIPPFVYGAVVTLPPGLRRATASLTATTPAVAGPPVPLSQATLIWSDAALPADPGHLLAQTSFGLQPIVGTITTTGNGVPTSQTFAMPAGALGIQFICHGTSPFLVPNEVKVVGDVTGDAYLDALQSFAPFGADMARWIPPDQNAICTVTDNGTNPARVTFVALWFSPTLNIRNSAGAPILVQSTNPQAWQRRAVDGQSVVANVAPGAASITIPAQGTGVSIIVNSALFTMDNRTGVAQVQGIRIWDGASGVGTLVWFSALQCATGTVTTGNIYPGAFLTGSPNTQMVLDFSGGVANLNESIFVDWYKST